MNHDAIIISGVSKNFIIPHEKQDTLIEFLSDPFSSRKNETYPALNNITLSIKEGETFGIIGNNGSGKSTLLKIIAGVYEADRGDVVVNGALVPFLELGVGFNPELTAKENIYLNGTILGMSRDFLTKKIDEIITFADLGRFVDLPVKNFSSGMYVRLAFSVAMMADANIYIVDEVLAVGDVNFQQKSLTLFRDLQKQGKTIIFVSHSLTQIESFCTRTAVLHKGEILFIGDTKEAITMYKNLNAAL
ncbi:ABC transporter ATP-binding protein [bacterium]|nr:ABC transporter ATP-binding protein [bacterium]